ncbi:MAG: class I SAM-dependent methyltransferase [Flavobacteriales bacterium]|nr:class I SAM-dependent methyltransferase [Flavobacteriales bacterium]
MKFKDNFLNSYLNEGTIPLAFERAFECELMSSQEYTRPILDIGCGDGIFAQIVFDEKIDTGLDPLAYELDSAREFNMYEELIEAYADKIPKPDGYYNTIFSNSVLEHIPDLKDVLIEANRVLADGGKFYITIPTIYFDQYSVVYQILSFLSLKGVAKSYQKFFNKFWNHHHYYSRENWIKLFEETGYKVDNVIEYGLKKDCLLNDFLAPFSLPNYIVKKLFNRWFLSNSLRKAYSPILGSMLKGRVKFHEDLRDGGLIFFALTKG